jgi:hypothetical protein
LSFITGPNQQWGFKYEGLALNKKMKWFASVGIVYGKSSQLNYATVNNKAIAYHSSKGYAQTFIQPSFNISYRPAIKTKHTFGIGFKFEKVADTISKLNWKYANGHKTIKYAELSYNIQYANVDFMPYPLKGFIGEASILKRGFGNSFNLWQLTAKSSVTKPLTQKYFLNLRAAGILKMPFSQPYIMQPVLGYNEMTMQGYEGYVMDGTAGAYAKIILLREIVNTALHFPSQKIKRLNYIPLRIYGKIFGNTGFVYQPQLENNHLNNKLLFSGGIGVDIVGLTDFVLKIEWSFNQLEGNGLSLSRRSYY